MKVAWNFLRKVYDGQTGWVDLPSKVGGRWVSGYVELPLDHGVHRRLAAAVRDGEDVYFSVATFAHRGRNHESAQSSAWLWADLDDANPAEAIRAGVGPTVLWESSRGRHQGLWRLRRRCTPGAIEKLNRTLSYALGADRSGWDLTQVLRVPSTFNHKYDPPQLVELRYDNGPSYDPTELYRHLERMYPQSVEQEAGESRPVRVNGLPARAKALLRVSEDMVVAGERSARFWELLCLLAESGWEKEEIVSVAEGTVWNKWRGHRRGSEYTAREVQKAIHYVSRRRRRDAVA